jgi:hypothetical protein
MERSITNEEKKLRTILSSRNILAHLNVKTELFFSKVYGQPDMQNPKYSDIKKIKQKIDVCKYENHRIS